MAVVTVLTAFPFDLSKLEKAVPGMAVQRDTGAASFVITQKGHHIVVTEGTRELAELSVQTVRLATELLGRPPRFAAACVFDDVGDFRYEWEIVVEFAKAVADRVPLAVLHDPAGATYLINPKRGLVSYEEYQSLRRPSTGDYLRRMLGFDR